MAITKILVTAVSATATSSVDPVAVQVAMARSSHLVEHATWRRNVIPAEPTARLVKTVPLEVLVKVEMQLETRSLVYGLPIMAAKAITVNMVQVVVAGAPDQAPGWTAVVARTTPVEPVAVVVQGAAVDDVDMVAMAGDHHLDW